MIVVGSGGGGGNGGWCWRTRKVETLEKYGAIAASTGADGSL